MNQWLGKKIIAIAICLVPLLASAQHQAEQYLPYELEIDLHAISQEDSALIGTKNPFDKAQIQLRAEFISPAGDTLAVNGYYSEDFVQMQDSTRHHTYWPYLPHEYLIAQNNNRGTWNVRFVPERAGTWKYSASFVLPANGRFVPAAAGQFECSAGNPRNGIVRMANRQYFAYPNGEAFRPLGINVAVHPEWCAYNPIRTFYDLYFKRLSENGGNFVRIWADFYASVYIFRPTGMPGHISMPDADHLDHIITSAERYGIKLQVCIFSANNFENPVTETGLTVWNDINTFSTRLGGPCSEPHDFFDTANAGAMAQQKNYIGYLIDRWGSSPAVLSWELINEAEGVTSDSALMVTWHREMYRFIKSYDIYHRAVTSSFMGGADRCTGPFKTAFSGLDYASLHRYVDQWGYRWQNSKDIWYNGTASYRSTLPDVPVCMGETGSFAGSPTYSDYEQLDTFALNYHSELWASLFYGGIMPVSYWDWNIFVQHAAPAMPASNYLKQFPAVQAFMQSMPPMGTKGYAPCRILPEKKSQLRAYYMQSSSQRAIWGWVQDEHLQINKLIGPEKHTGHAYLRALDPALRPPRTGEKNILKIKDLPVSGEYRICWYSTETGLPVAEERRSARFRRIALPVPDALLNGRYGDAAFSVIYAGEGAE